MLIKYFNILSIYGCIGFLVNLNIVVMVGYCVYSQDYGWVLLIIVVSGCNDFLYFYGIYLGMMFYFVKGWMESKNINYDYGVVKLNGFLGNMVGWYGYRIINSSSFVGFFLLVIGYLCDKVFGMMWFDIKLICFVEMYKLIYIIDMYGC